MTWFVFEMARNEVIQRRLCAEVDALFDTMIDAHSRTERLMEYRPALDNAVSTTAQQNHTQCNMPSREAHGPQPPPACLLRRALPRAPVRCMSIRTHKGHGRARTHAVTPAQQSLFRCCCDGNGALALTVDRPVVWLWAHSQWHPPQVLRPRAAPVPHALHHGDAAAVALRAERHLP